MMWIKRIVPFVLALALGLFIASFFVNIGASRFKNRRHYQQYKTECQTSNYRQHREIEFENREVKNVELNNVPRENYECKSKARR